MGWFDKPGEMEPAVAHALRIARDWDVPFQARSVTRDEQIDRRHDYLPWILGCYGLFALFVLLLVAGTAAPYGGLVGVLVSVAIALPMLVGFASLVRKAAADWAERPGTSDARNSIEVGADGYVFRDESGAHGVTWFEVDARVRYADSDSETSFAGLDIDGPFGRIELCDHHYHDGRAAAALIVRGMHDAWWKRERDKVERMI